MKNIIDLSGKSILITGASSGIGAETARLCSSVGARVILVARRSEKLEEVMSSLEKSNHTFYSFDLENLLSIEDFIKELCNKEGRIDGFVHSAGISGTRPLKLMKVEALQKIMNVNFASFVEIVRCITKKNYFNKNLSIVGVSSISSLIGSLGKTGYCASKAAMDAAVRCMAKELFQNEIRVNTICPGIVNTEIYQEFKDNAGDSHDAQMKLERQYLGICQPIDIANAICFLLSDLSRMITGTSIKVDGGMLSS